MSTHSSHHYELDYLREVDRDSLRETLIRSLQYCHGLDNWCGGILYHFIKYTTEITTTRIDNKDGWFHIDLVHFMRKRANKLPDSDYFDHVKALVKYQLVESLTCGNPPKIFYRVNHQRLVEMLLLDRPIKKYRDRIKELTNEMESEWETSNAQ